MIGLMFLIFAVCMILAIPVGFSIAISATAFLFFDAGIPIFSIVQKMIDGINSFSYLALPLFVLSGAIMVYGATGLPTCCSVVFPEESALPAALDADFSVPFPAPALPPLHPSVPL